MIKQVTLGNTGIRSNTSSNIKRCGNNGYTRKWCNTGKADKRRSKTGNIFNSINSGNPGNSGHTLVR